MSGWSVAQCPKNASQNVPLVSTRKKNSLFLREKLTKELSF